MGESLTRSLELMRRAQDGDRESLSRLCERYYPRVRSVVRARLGAKIRSRHDSGDVLQRVFVVALRKYDQFKIDDEASLIGWLAQIAERQIHDLLDELNAGKRDLAREQPLEAGEAGVAYDLPAADPAPFERLAAGEERHGVEECLAKLRVDHRELILWRDYMGANWEQVAEETGRPSAAAARMMHAQALIELGKLLRRHVRSEGGEAGPSR